MKTHSSKRRFGAGSSLGAGSERGFCGWEVEGAGEVVSMVEGSEETWLDCVRGAATGGATVARGCVGGGGGESGFRGATLKPGPNVKGDCVFEAESPRDGSPLLEGLSVDVEGPADMILLSAVNRTGRFEVGEEVGESSLHPTSA
jgi:hypothetical protein